MNDPLLSSPSLSSSSNDNRYGPKIAIVGGGLAGLAAAVALAKRNIHVELFESRRVLGGRAGSFLDSTSGQWLDHCQHVSLGCCTNFQHFCQTVGINNQFQTIRELNFIAPNGKQYQLYSKRYLPAPMHLLPAFLRLGYLTIKQRLSICITLLKLARISPAKAKSLGDFESWLKNNKQSPRVIDQFWAIVLVSALSETLDRIDVAVARKVFVDGFMANRQGYEIAVPKVALGELYQQIHDHLVQSKATVHLSTPVDKIRYDSEQYRSQRKFSVITKQGDSRTFDFVIVATTWRYVTKLLSDEMLMDFPEISQAEKLQSAPITAIHLWYDRKITELPHALIVGKLSQWMFYRGKQQWSQNRNDQGEYYQVIISAAYDIPGQNRDSVIDKVCQEMSEIFPQAAASHLLQSKLITQREAVFSPIACSEKYRLSQKTPIANLMLAGDWTLTGWPATMESAVRSGYLAAQELLQQLGRPEKLLRDELPRNPLVRCLLK